MDVSSLEGIIPTWASLSGSRGVSTSADSEYGAAVVADAQI